MTHNLLKTVNLLFLACIFSATNLWAMDADDPQSEPDAIDEHVSSAPDGHEYTKSGEPKKDGLAHAMVKTDASGKKVVDVASAQSKAASLAKAATDPSAVLTGRF